MARRSDPRPKTRMVGVETPPSAAPTTAVWRRPALLASVLVFVLLIGVLLVRTGSSGKSPSPAGNRASAAPTGNSSGGTGSSGDIGSGAGGQGLGQRLVEGVPVGYPDSREGATAAAVNYEVARSSSRYFTDAPVRERVLRTIMATDAVSSQLKSDNTAADRLATALGVTADTSGSLIARASSMGTKVLSFSPQVATVSVWMAGIVGMATPRSPLPVSASWTTYTLVLVWQGDDWKVSSITTSNGPTPLQTTDQQPTSVDVFASMDKEYNAPPYVG